MQVACSIVIYINHLSVRFVKNLNFNNLLGKIFILNPHFIRTYLA